MSYRPETCVAHSCDIRTTVTRHGSAPILVALVVVLALAGCAGHDTRPAARGHHHGAEDFSWGAARAGAQNDPGGDAAIVAALQSHYRDWAGVPYRYGGRDRSGIDCSSFVRRTLDAVESIDLPRTTAAQAQRGEAIGRGDLSPGDLVFFRTGGGNRHVGIYIGDGRFMHASTSRGVTLSRLDNIYWRRHYWQSRRITTAHN